MITPRRFYLKRPPQPFRGSVRGSHFKVIRVLGMFVRNSFQPVVVGDIAQGPVGTEIRVRMRLHAGVATFMAIWFGLLLIGAGVFVRSATTHASRQPLGFGLSIIAGMA